MSNTAESLQSEDEDFVVKRPFTSGYSRNKKDQYESVILKASENIFKTKSKCNRALKKKLKKYKLRKDGQEDPDVLYVSRCLDTSLKIKSPVGVNNNNESTDENISKWELKNYLTKIAKQSSYIMKASGSVSKKNYGKTDEPQTDSEENKMPADQPKRQVEENNFLSHSEDELVSKNQEINPQNKPKEMNAFQLMMNSRNKSIGSNSPGKEKSLELTEDEKAKKLLKVKRNMALEKMAQDKGSLKNIEAEALKDERIKIKMNKRARRLKNMLTKPTTSEHHQSEDSGDNCRKSNSSSKQTTKRRRKSDNNSEKIIKRLKTDSCENEIIHIDDDVQEADKQKTEENKSMVKEKMLINGSLDICKKISKSDAEFLNKLSPSMKKKESMLSYFGKIEKIDEIEVKVDPLPENVIKVKFTPRRKKKEKKEKRKITKHETLKNANEEAQKTHKETTEIEQKEIILDDKYKKEEKRKLKVNENQVTSKEKINFVAESTEQSLKIKDCSERRSKRANKKPVKYQDGADSPPEQDSDDDLMIITPEHPNLKKKTSGSLLKLKKPIAPKVILKDSSVGKNEKEKNSTQHSKLAPIFAQKNQLSKAEMEAKQNFLQSGIPDKLKKIIDRQKSFELENDYFTTVYHVQQKMLSVDDFNPWTLKPIIFNLLSEDNHFDVTHHNDNFLSNFKFETMLKNVDKSRKPVDCKETLQLIKSNYPRFPVYRTFRLLKNKCTPDTMQCSQDLHLDTLEKSSDVIQDLLETKDDQNLTMWSDKFRPTCTSDIIGNFEGVKALKKWLTVWKETHLEGKNQQIRQRSDSSDSSDFYYPSDTDSRDSTKSYNNVLVVTGPVGSGKTSAIYAVATELSIKVIEVNASAKRTGKTILSNLQEATQSHKVNRGTTSAENTQNSQELPRSKFKMTKNKHLKTYSKKGAKSLQSLDTINEVLSDSQASKNENNRTGMSLILIEDADLVFEQDDGFVSALNQIVQISKRPVILVTASLTCPHLQRFVTNGNVFKFHRLSSKMLGTWLDLMCLVENGNVWPDIGQNLLEFFEGDIRKAINALQFWVASDTSNSKSDLDSKELLPNTDSQERLGVDECSTTSWSDQDQRPLKDIQTSEGSKVNAVQLNKELFKTFISVNDHDIGINKSILQLPVDHLNIWWNIPHLFVSENANNVDTTENVDVKNNVEKACLKSLTKLIDSISASDLMFAKMRPSLNVSVTSSPWKSKLYDSVSEAVNMLSFNSSVPLSDSLSYALLTTSINITQRTFGIKDDELCVDYALPGMSQIRSRERIITRHNGLYDCLSLHCRLDRRGLAMDYLSTCREICRIEKNKSDNNCKRNNRFHHYLRSMKAACSSETLDTLCESLGSGDK